MNLSFLILITIFFPILCGVIVLLKREFADRKTLMAVSCTALFLTGLCAVLSICQPDPGIVLLHMGSDMTIYFHIDNLGRLFAVVISVIWISCGIFSTEYMKHEQEEKRYFGFYILVYGVLMGLCFAGNIITFYLFYEMMSLTTMPLVMHERTREAIWAGIKYLLYSLCGAYLVLFGIYFLNQYTTTLNFTPMGTLDQAAAAAHPQLMLVVALLMILGFGVKAGMFPMHGWLPTAHPVAPAPASAVLSSLIVKMGVLGVIRVVYYLIGADFLRGTWVQMVWLILALITVFMGSMQAYREKLLKKRLAYSTVSQVSYILFGLALLDPQAMTGSLLHVVFHASIKSCLFLTAGAIIFKTGKKQVNELTGIGKEMPVTIWCYTFASLALIGIPPASGFVSKWYLATGSLETGISVISWLGPVILLISALLTAGYLLPITISGFLPGADYDYENSKHLEPSMAMLIPLILLGGAALLLGVFPTPLIRFVTGIVEGIL